MKAKLNAKSALLVVLFYLVFSLFASLFASIFFGGAKTDSVERFIDQTIDSGMYALLAVMVVLLFIGIVVFKDSRRDIFFERKKFSLSKWYYFFPIVQIAVVLFALFNVEFSAFSMREILLVIVAALTIGVNEELVTRGILLVGLRNGGMAEWKVWLGTILAFSLLHLINVIAGGSLLILLITLTGGILYYVARRIFGNLFVPIILHAAYDTAFFLLPGPYPVNASLPDNVLNIQLGAFLVGFVLSILFLAFGRKLFKAETVAWV